MAAEASPRGGGRRTRGNERREYPVTVKLSKTEKAILSAAAQRAGMALAAYVCEAAMDAAEHRAVPVPKVHREMLAELFRVADLVRRAGTNLNQAVARLNSTGEPGADLGPSAAYCIRVLEHVDRAAELIRRRLG
jgi:uncharacterized protein (DUF1778 family)